MTAPSENELASAYSGRRVFLTGHTGFKGSWLALWLTLLGADVTGFALSPDTIPALFDQIGLASLVRHQVGDVRDQGRLYAEIERTRPDFVFHLAAQSLVRRGYRKPAETFATNVMGVVHLLDAVRRYAGPCAVVVVTSDKCYENERGAGPRREEDPLGGRDPYSASKGAAELVVGSYRRSFFSADERAPGTVALASGRAGNVVGGGDWAEDRIVPDTIRALRERRPVAVRHPASVRPWQHVLEPLAGYLLLGARLNSEDAAIRAAAAEAWNFGPEAGNARPVGELVELVIEQWGSGSWEERQKPDSPPEAESLTLSATKARQILGWAPRWNLAQAVRHTVEWYRAADAGASGEDLRGLMETQIQDYLRTS